MDNNLYYFSFTDRFCNFYCRIPNNIDYYSKNIMGLLCIYYVISDLNNSVFSPGLLLINLINCYI